MIKQFSSVRDIPVEWDAIAEGNIYLKVNFLSFLERVSSYPMEFYGIYVDGLLDSIFVTFYKKKHNIGMFSKKDFYLATTLFYIPLSITQPGFVINKGKEEFDDFYKKTKGCKLLLNSDKNFFIDGFGHGYTCPQCILELRWKSFDDYLASMRSNYRYRYKKALQRSEGLSFEYLSNNSMFDDSMYQLYLEVYEASRFKIEKLEKEFFQGSMFQILVLKLKGETVGFVQLLHDGEQLIFEFVGFNHELNEEYDIYMRLLLEIVRYGIEKDFKTIDFGQTADDAKLKLGCYYKYLYAVIGHSNFIMNGIIKFQVKRLEYNFIKQKFNIFKEVQNESSSG